MPAASSLLRLSACALLALASLSVPALAQVTTADQCAEDPMASISIDGQTGPLNNGAIFACPASGQIGANFQGIAPQSTADNLRVRYTNITTRTRRRNKRANTWRK